MGGNSPSHISYGSSDTTDNNYNANEVNNSPNGNNTRVLRT